MPEQHVLIIGAGITGLAIAQGLKKAGIPYTIFEAEDHVNYRIREWTIALHWSLAMLKELLPEELGDSLKSRTAVDPSADFTSRPANFLPMVDGVSGELIKEIPTEGEYMRCSRQRLRSLCAEQIDVQWAHALKDIVFKADGSAQAVFANGKSYSGSIIVGADGSRSVVRRCLLGDSGNTKRLGIPSIAVDLCYKDAEKARFVRGIHPIQSMAVHPDGAVFLALLNSRQQDKAEDWKFYLLMFWPPADNGDMNQEQLHAKAKELSKGICEPYKSAIQWIPDDVQLHYDPLSYWIGTPFDTHAGSVVLAGDAAHPMPPNRGQACNHALNDAFNFVNGVKHIRAGANQATTIQAYSDEVIERGAKETMLSKFSAEKSVDYANFKDHGVMKHGLSRSPEEVRNAA